MDFQVQICQHLMFKSSALGKYRWARFLHLPQVSLLAPPTSLKASNAWDRIQLLSRGSRGRWMAPSLREARFTAWPILKCFDWPLEERDGGCSLIEARARSDKLISNTSFSSYSRSWKLGFFCQDETSGPHRILDQLIDPVINPRSWLIQTHQTYCFLNGRC